MQKTSPGRKSAKVVLAPGARIVVRTEEWLVRRVDPSADGGCLRTCAALPERLRGMSAKFLAELKGSVEMLEPALRALSLPRAFSTGWIGLHEQDAMNPVEDPCP
jgi:hypothetical protein